MDRLPAGVSATPPGSRLLLAAILYLLVNAIGLWLVAAGADQDQAQQLLLSQGWALGYGPQPPLYTYLVNLVFQVTGPALWPLLALKVVLLSLLVAAVLRIGRELRLRGDQQLMALSGLILIPQFIWESQRDLSHSLLATAVAAWTLVQLLRLLRRPSAANHALLGVLVAAGLLSKYSVALFLASLLLTALTIPALRRALLQPQLLLGVAVALALLSPHLVWMLSNPELALAGLEKTRAGEALPWRGVLSALGAAVAFLSPFWLAALAVLWPQRRHLHIADPTREPGSALLQRLPLALMGVLLVFVLSTGATRIKDRWYQSLLFYAPISAATLASPLPRRRLRWMVGAGVGAAAAVAILLPARTTLAGISGRSSRPNYPLPQLVLSLGEAGGTPELILASSTLLAGNARLAFPTVPVLTPKAPAPGAGRPPLPGGSKPRVLVLIDQGDDPAATLALLTSLLPLEPGQLRTHSLPLRWAQQQRYTIRYAWLGPAPGAQDGDLPRLPPR
ncbi:glycosyltransferase family 39 protein [Cyanobium sp. ATX 6A2]|uniref:glycosyltransferase family 39 protein n=1 Tax=Cyanobium sp. ATX 6A2 TaxID=2823700 RepID=UPI0020CDFED9|nr:glycosyltransferase family 39 protein [Cyanobium sp. ATX 6A2]MCP9887601.1 glycosyltransferase family 39 protein [Cyanobium sp. ATX 6A2]